MQKFPILNESQVVVLHAEVSTGHVLDINLSLAISDTQIVFQIFESLNEALDHINQLKGNNPNIEFVIYDSNEKFIRYIGYNQKNN